MPDSVNLKLYQGDDYAAQITVMEADGSTPADLTGYTAQSQIRASVTDTSEIPVAQFTATITANVITILLTHDDTKALVKPTYVWDLQVIDSNGWITTLLAGQVAVTKEVTKVYAPSAFAVMR